MPTLLHKFATVLFFLFGKVWYIPLFIHIKRSLILLFTILYFLIDFDASLAHCTKMAYKNFFTRSHTHCVLNLGICLLLFEDFYYKQIGLCCSCSGCRIIKKWQQSLHNNNIVKAILTKNYTMSKLALAYLFSNFMPHCPIRKVCKQFLLFAM